MRSAARTRPGPLLAALIACLIAPLAALAQPTFGPKKPPAAPDTPTAPDKPDPAKPAPKPALPAKPSRNAPPGAPAPEEWNADDPERREPDGDAKPGEWYCWKTADGLRYAWSLPTPFVKGKAYDLVVMLHPAQMDFRWGPANHARGPDAFGPDCLTVSVDGVTTNDRRPEIRSFEPTAANCVRFRDALLEFSRVLPVRHIILYGQGGAGGGGQFAAFFSGQFPALADGVLDHGGGVVEGGAVKSTVPIVLMHGAKDSITPLRASVDGLKAYQDAGHKSIALRVLREYNDFPNEACAGECIDYLRAMCTDDPAEVVALTTAMLAPKSPDEFGYRPMPWFTGALRILARFDAADGPQKFDAEPSAEIRKRADALRARIDAEAEAAAGNIRKLLAQSEVQKGDFILDGGPWLGYLLVARDDFRSCKPIEALAAELKLDEQIARHTEHAAELWAVWSASAQDGEKYQKAVEEITRCYLCEALPTDLLARCRACVRKAEELEIDAESRNMLEFIQLWDQGWRDGLDLYQTRLSEWSVE